MKRTRKCEKVKRKGWGSRGKAKRKEREEERRKTHININQPASKIESAGKATDDLHALPAHARVYLDHLAGARRGVF